MREYDFSTAKALIQDEMKQSGTPSVAIAVAENGAILWEEGFGWADKEKRMPADEHTMYCIASTTKPYTATGLMKLVEQGKLELDEPINHYLPEDYRLKVWIGNPDDVTVRRVANHTAGLPSHCNFYSSDEIGDRPPMPESIRRYGNIVTLPGERYCYSNIGYGVLDHLIELISGMTYGDFLRREIFVPLELTRSSVDIAAGLADFAATRYGADGLPVPAYDVDHPGASSVCSSVHDLVRFGMFHLKQLQQNQRAVLADETLDAMRVPSVDRANPSQSDRCWPPRSGYGIGWVIDDDELGLRISHAGGMRGVVAQLVLMPREGLAMAAVANGPSKIPHQVEKYILPALSPVWTKRIAARDEKAKTRIHQPDARFQPSPELLGEWSGFVHTYEKDVPFSLFFKPAGDVHARLGEQLMSLVSEAKFEHGWLTGIMLGRIFTEDATRCLPKPYDHVRLDLKLRGDRINGALIAVAANGTLSYWAELRKK